MRLEGRRTDDGHIQVAIIDSCGGIPEASLSRVFDLAGEARLRSGDDGGAGLGLAIARGVVESHGGEILVSNVEGGCRFEVACAGPGIGSITSTVLASPDRSGDGARV